MSELHAHFQPLRQPSRTSRVVLLLAGPLLWLVFLVALAVVAKKTDFIVYGLVIAGGSFLLGGAIHFTARAQRLREEQTAPGR
jgi:hypothetical protein